MQCPRCYFSNPAGTRVCEYCGAKLESTTGSAPAPGSASSKRQTMLGPLPTAPERPASRPRRAAPIDPDDPFRIAARGAGPATVVPPVPDTLGGISTIAFDAPSEPEPPAPAPAPEPVRPRHRPTLVGSRASVSSDALAGVALIVHSDGRTEAVVLREGRIRIGRRAELEIVIDDPMASGDHAILRVENGRAWLLDTSANGTIVSGVECVNDRVDVSDDTVLRIGSTAIVLQLLGSEALAALTGLG